MIVPKLLKSALLLTGIGLILGGGFILAMPGGDAPVVETASSTAPAIPASATLSASTQPSGSQTAVAIPPTKPISGDFGTLLKRSLFTDARRKGSAKENGLAIKGEARPEASYVLRGTYLRGRRYTALVEHLPSQQVTSFGIGEAVGRGGLRSISLHGVEFEMNGAVTPIAVGQAFDGLEPLITAVGTTLPAADKNQKTRVEGDRSDKRAEPETAPSEKLTKKRLKASE